MSINSITLVTSSHLSSNPRLVKEASALIEKGYEVHIVCQQNIEYLSAFDSEIFTSLSPAKISVIKTDGNQNKLLKFKSALRKKIGHLSRKIGLNSFINWEINGLYPEMIKLVACIKTDIYIGHTLASLPVIQWASRKHQVPFAFDAEDFHRAELENSDYNFLAQILEDKILPQAAYISTASPLSTEAYQKLYPKQKIITINNVFNPVIKNLKTSKPNKIKMVWFSQTIGLNRGLQAILREINLLPAGSFEVHLRGTSDEDTRKELLNCLYLVHHSNIFFYPQCRPSELNDWLPNFDIGLALEERTPLNRDLCLTNKIFQYLSAGLALLATETQGQKWLLTNFPNCGFLINSETNSFYNILNHWHQNPENLRELRKNALDIALNNLNWNLEKKKLWRLMAEI